MIALEKDHSRDPGLLAFYKDKLLIPGWSGILTDAEAEYIGQELAKSPNLRGVWRRALREAGYTGQRRKRPSVFVVKLWNEVLTNPVECPQTI